jgi:phage baseplate assembly protein W
MIHTPKFPLKFDDRTTFANADDLKQISMFHLKNVILTSPGEKISDPSFGVGIRRYLFENLSVGLLNNIAQDIIDEVRRHIGYITLVDVKVFTPADSNKLSVSIVYSVPGFLENESILIDVEPSGESSY